MKSKWGKTFQAKGTVDRPKNRRSLVFLKKREKASVCQGSDEKEMTTSQNRRRAW